MDTKTETEILLYNCNKMRTLYVYLFIKRRENVINNRNKDKINVKKNKDRNLE